MSGISKPLGRALWSLYFVDLVIASVFIAWFGVKQLDYLFPQGYRFLNIAETIRLYGPENRFRKQFETTSEAERFRIFDEIVEAVHNNGKGLTSITYHNNSGTVIDTFLTAAEINHLQDVAKLFNLGKYLGWFSLSAPLLLWLLKKTSSGIPKFRQVLISALSSIAGITLLILLAGPTRVFYALHEMIFPKNHQWFFYYQDSLMTMLMQAPNLFGYIGAWIGALATLMLCGLIAGTYVIFRK